LFLPLPVPRSARGTRHDGVSRFQLRWLIGDNNASTALARNHASRGIATAALFAWINTNSKFLFDDGCTSRLEQY
jgi:hypothetical protein